MSTKIYNGIKIYSNSLDELLQKINLIKPEAQQLTLEKEVNGLNRQIINQYLNTLLLNVSKLDTSLFLVNYNQNEEIKSHNRILISYLLDIIKENEKNYSKIKNVSTDIKTTSLIIHPHQFKDSLGKYYIGHNYSDLDLNTLTSIFKNNNTIFQDYHYQNQTDKPEEITTKSWNRRSKEWNICLDYGDTPISRGISIQLSELNGYYFDFKHPLQHYLTTIPKNNEKLMLKFLNNAITDNLHALISPQINQKGYSLLMKIESNDLPEEFIIQKNEYINKINKFVLPLLDHNDIYLNYNEFEKKINTKFLELKTNIQLTNNKKNKI